jgi:plastocyanin
MARLLALAAAFAAAATLTTRPADAQPAQFASIKGQVVLPVGKPIPQRPPLPVNVNQQVCLKNGPILDESRIVDPKTRGIKNVLVWLRPDNADPKKSAIPADKIHPDDAKRQPATVVIDQPCCMFTARITPARVGDMVEVKNPAPIAHNFFWVSAANGNFNVTIQPVMAFNFGPLLPEAGVIEYKCTIHPWMNGYVKIFDHPYYAVTDERGNFEMKNCPVGKWRVVIWHERVGFLDGKAGRFGRPVDVTRTGGDMKVIEFDL